MREPLRPKPLSAPRWRNQAIIDAASRLMGQYEAIVGREYITTTGLSFDHFYEHLIFPKFGVNLYEDDDLGEDGDGHKLLGRYDVRGNAAHLDQIISRESNDPRRTYTCWHEVAGHGVLQGAWLRKQLERPGGRESIDVTEISLSPDEERILERQANLFASHLAAPDWLVNYAINTIFRPTRKFYFKEPCVYYLEGYGLKIKNYIFDAGHLSRWIGAKISALFGGLSAEALGYRITALGWIDDRSLPNIGLHRSAKSLRPSFQLADELSACVADLLAAGKRQQASASLMEVA